MSIFQTKVFRNASWIIACRLAQSLISLVISMVCARYLGPSGYGLISYAASVVTFVLPLAQLGLRSVLVEQLMAHPDREGQILGTSMVLSGLSSLVCMVGCVVFVALANAGEGDTLLVCGLYSLSLIFQVTEQVQYWYQARLLSKYTALVSLGAYVVVAAYKVVLLVTGGSIYWFALAYALDYLLISAALLVLYRRSGGQKLGFSLALGRALVGQSRYYILSGMMVTVFTQTDRIMIKMLLGNAENGYYATAVSCATLTNFVFTAVIDSVRPMILASNREDQEKFRRNMARLYSLILYMGLGQSLVLTLLAKPLVGLLYGRAYLAAVPLLQIVTWYSAFSHMGTVRNIWILAQGRQKYLWIVNLSGAVLNVAGNFLLIPRMGAAGAAVASVVTQAVTNVGLTLLIPALRPNGGLMLRALDPRRLLELLPGRR